MASHRMPDDERPRRAVPAWVTAPPEGDGLEARPTPVASAPAPETVGPGSTLPTVPPASAPDDDADIVVPDYPPQEDLLPPAPTSPAVHTVPFEQALLAPAPVSPIDAAPPAPVVPAVPVVGQPRFSVPGLEHVVVEGTEPAPTGPIGYRTPARFARQQAPLPAPASAPTPTRSFDAVIAPPASAPTAAPSSAPAPAPESETTAPPAEATDADGGEPRLQADPVRVRKPLVGATPGAVLGAVAGLATLGLAAWWFLAPATVHGVGLVLGVLALVLSIVTLRNRAATWQRPIALLGAVLGGVGTLVLLWAVASAVLPLAGVTLPDLTGTGATPTLVP
ncbi:hypothetical protein [Curtobacterium sp. 1544]|uniref:hypothetical protein n=1 Tax=Curtobacterium sp. 1544 TaxID=3156417 RepID=UPI003390BE98